MKLMLGSSSIGEVNGERVLTKIFVIMVMFTTQILLYIHAFFFVFLCMDIKGFAYFIGLMYKCECIWSCLSTHLEYQNGILLRTQKW